MKVERFAFLPDLALGLVYLAAWTVPALVGAGAAGWLVLGIELEALALLGAYLLAMGLVAVLDPTAKVVHRLSGTALIVGVMVFAAVQLVRHQFWWPAIALAALVGNRLAGLITGRLATEDARMELLFDALLGLGLYVVAIGPSFYLPVPSFGADLGPLPPEHARWCAVPGDFVADFFDAAPSGDWCAQPHRALAGGALYFLVAALRDARRFRRARRRGRSSAHRSRAPTAAVLLVLVAGAASCSIVFDDETPPLTGAWRAVETSPAGYAIELGLVEQPNARLTGSGSVTLGGATYAFAVDSGLVSTTRLRFRLRDGTNWFGSFDGRVSYRNEITGSLFIGTAPDGRVVQARVAARLVRVPPD